MKKFSSLSNITQLVSGWSENVNLMNLVPETIYNHYTNSFPSVAWTNSALSLFGPPTLIWPTWITPNNPAHSDAYHPGYQINIISVPWLNKSMLIKKDSVPASQRLTLIVYSLKPSLIFFFYIFSIPYECVLLFWTFTTFFCLVLFLIGTCELLHGRSHVWFGSILTTFHKAWHNQMFVEEITRYILSISPAGWFYSFPLKCGPFSPVTHTLLSPLP